MCNLFCLAHDRHFGDLLFLFLERTQAGVGLKGSVMVEPQPQLAVVILAAGQGTRMKSRRAKVMHEIAGKPMLDYVLRVAERLEPQRIVTVVGKDSEEVEAYFEGRTEFVRQLNQKGTGHAVLQARKTLENFSGEIFVLYGDTPLLCAETLRGMVSKKRISGASLTLLSTKRPLPGLLQRDQEGFVERIIESTDATTEELKLVEYNSGVYLIRSDFIWGALDELKNENAQGELYLTDLVEIAVSRGLQVEAIPSQNDDEVLGVNNRAELAEAEAIQRGRNLSDLLENGVTFVDPATTYIDTGVEIGQDSRVEPGCSILGETRLGEGVQIKANSIIESSTIENDVQIGPFAHLRPNCHIGSGTRIGNYVEVKNSTLGRGVKADHLSYIGDADVGDEASFGCGAIVVNYDGVNKHRTSIGARAFIGCNVNLVAPIRIDSDTFVAAGSTITKDVPRDALVVAREKQRTVEGWVTKHRKVRE